MRRPFPVLRTTRLELRPYAPEDAPELHRLLTDPAVRRYLLDDVIVDRSWVEEEVATTRMAWRSNGWGQLAMRVGRQRAIVGICGLRPFHDPERPELLYALAPAWQGRGLALEGAAAVVRYAFEVLGFDVVRASTDTPNVASQRVMRRLGMELREEGTRVRGRVARTSWTADSGPWALRWSTSAAG